MAVGRTALTGGDVEFEEAMQYAVMALSVLAHQHGAAERMQSRYAQLPERGPFGPLPSDADPSSVEPDGMTVPELMDRDRGDRREQYTDRWGVRKRRLGALADAIAYALHDHATAAQLVDQAAGLPFGFAGYHAPACLSLLESVQVAGANPGLIQDFITAARRSAHKVQDPTLCARTTARVNAADERWWSPATPLVAREVAKRLCEAPTSAEFAALHMVGEAYSERGTEGKPLPDWMRQARSLAALSEVYQRPLSEFVRLNPSLGDNPEVELPYGTQVNVPDPRFVTMIAARIAAEALADPGLDEEQRLGIIWSLVPVAATNATALDAVLARLLLAAGPAALAELGGLEQVAMRAARRTAAELATPSIALPS
jgi:hypothetical protein